MSYTFAPAVFEIGLDAWERCGIQAGELTTTHFNSMRRSMNLVFSRWSNRGINLWKVTLTDLPMVIGQAVYSVDSTVIDVLDTYISVPATPAASEADVIMTSISRGTYASLADKDQAGRPIQYWYDRLRAQTLTVWPVPDALYVVHYYAFSQIAGADPAGGTTAPDVPYRFLEAYTASVAAHLAIKWAPERALALDASAKESWGEAMNEDREKTTQTIVPDLSDYFA